MPCTLSNIDSLIGKGRAFEPDVVIIKIRRNDFTGEFSLLLSVEALHTAIDHAEVVATDVDGSVPFTQGQSVVDAKSFDYLIEENAKPVYSFPPPDFENLSPEEKRIGALIANHFITDGATLQVGIGKMPDAVIGSIRDGGFKDLGSRPSLMVTVLCCCKKKVSSPTAKKPTTASAPPA